MTALTQTVIAEAVSALRAGSVQDGCKLLVGLDTPRVLWANANAEALFGTSERLTLSRRIFGSASDARPLATRLRRLEPGAAPHLEGVQITSRFARTSVVFRCAAVPGSSPRLILLETIAAPGVRAAGPESRTALVPAEPVLQPTPNLPAAAPGSFSSAGPESDADHPARFRWRTDGNGAISQVGPEMQAALGRAALQIGDDLQGRLRSIGSASTRDAADAMASGRGWSGATMAWPGEGGASVAEVTLGGTPAPGGAGHRGYGLIRRPATAMPASAEDTPSDSARDEVETTAGPPDPAPTAQVGPEDVPEPVSADVSRMDASDGLDLLPTEPTGPAETASLADTGSSSDDAPPIAIELRDEEPPSEPSIMLLPVTETGPELTQSEEARPNASAPDGSAPLPSPADDPTPLPEPRLLQFPRAVDSGTSKVVHLAAFKTGVPALSGKAAIRRDSSPPPASDLSTLAPPQWAEAPPAMADGAGADQRLSSHERLNFDEIARALATLPLVDAGRRTVPGQSDVLGEHRPAEPSRGPDMPSLAANTGDLLGLLNALPDGVLIASGTRTLFANQALLDLAGYEDAGALDAAGGLGRLLGFDDAQAEAERPGRRMAARGRDGVDRDVHVASRAVTWMRSPAVLWSIRAADAAADPVRPQPSPTVPDRADLMEALDLAASGVGFVDGRGRIVSINGGAERLFGHAARDLAGENSARLFAGEPDESWRTFFDAFANDASRTSAFGKMTARKRSGEEIPVGVSLRRIAPDRICIVWQQSVHGHATASELDLLRRDAERASALKSEFLAKISHEIRTPLNAMLGFTEIIIEERFGPVGNDRYREYLKDIHTSGTHVVSLVNDLLDLSRIEAGALELTLGPVDANLIIGECVAAMQGQAFRDRVVIRTSLAACAPMALADDRSFRQIVLNLLSNAVKFNEPGGQVIVSTALSDSGRVLVRVRDTGPGMSEGDVETAMKPFRQLATPKASAGTGLGLPLTKAMIEACHGSLRLTSKPGEGTLAEITFQRAPDLPVSLPAE